MMPADLVPIGWALTLLVLHVAALVAVSRERL